MVSFFCPNKNWRTKKCEKSLQSCCEWKKERGESLQRESTVAWKLKVLEGDAEGDERRGKMGEKPLVFSAGPAAEGEVRLWGDGRKRGRAKAGWVTWAFVGRWWEAPPWPLALNAKQRCHCLASAAAADACAGGFSGNQEQKQTPSPPHLPPGFAHTRPTILLAWKPVHLNTR